MSDQKTTDEDDDLRLTWRCSCGRRHPYDVERCPSAPMPEPVSQTTAKHDPKLVEGMAREMTTIRIVPVDWAHLVPDAATALTALARLRPDIAAVLDGRGVVVPREISVAQKKEVRENGGNVALGWAIAAYPDLIAAAPTWEPPYAT